MPSHCSKKPRLVEVDPEKDRRAQGDDEDGPAQLQQGVARVPGQRGLRRRRHHGAQDGGGRRVTSQALRVRHLRLFSRCHETAEAVEGHSR